MTWFTSLDVLTVILLIASLTIAILACGISFMLINRSRKSHKEISKIISLAEMRNQGPLMPKSLLNHY